MVKYTSEQFMKDRADSLKKNAFPRVAIGLAVDTSASMSANDKIGALNKGIMQFGRAVRDDDDARRRAEVCVVAFDSNVETILDFGPIQSQLTVLPKGGLRLTAQGSTALGKGVAATLDKIEERTKEYKKHNPYYQPWLVIMSDGVPCRDDDALRARTQCAVSELALARKLVVIPIAIGDSADIAELQKFSPITKVTKINEVRDFGAFFKWLSQSVTKVSQSTMGADEIAQVEDMLKNLGEYDVLYRTSETLR